MTLHATGAPENRFNIVIAAEGYTEGDLPKFRAQADKHLNVLWSIERYSPLVVAGLV